MDRGQLVFLQIKLNERSYLLLCDPMSPLPEIREALCVISLEVQKIEDEQLASQVKPEPEKVDG